MNIYHPLKYIPGIRSFSIIIHLIQQAVSVFSEPIISLLTGSGYDIVQAIQTVFLLPYLVPTVKKGCWDFICCASQPSFISQYGHVNPNPSTMHSYFTPYHCLHDVTCFLIFDPSFSFSLKPKYTSFVLWDHYLIIKEVSHIPKLFSTSFCSLLVLTEIWLSRWCYLHRGLPCIPFITTSVFLWEILSYYSISA